MKIYQTELNRLCGGTWKYVVVNDKYRFVSGVSGYSHADMIEKDEKATSAGLIAIFDFGWRMYDTYSSTLKIGASPVDYQRITDITGLKLIDDF